MTAGLAKLFTDAPRIEKLSQFEEVVREHADRWWQRNHYQMPKFWFRGHAGANWKLCPPALREERRPASLDSHFFVEFKRRAVGLLDRLPSNDWSWLYLAQHHGFPTRLLDWTESSHVALFFALCTSRDTDVREDACVWVLNPGELNERKWGFSNVVTMGDHHMIDPLLQPYRSGKEIQHYEGGAPHLIAVIPDYVTPRLRGQRGAFVAFANDPNALEKEAAVEAGGKPPMCMPIILDKDHLWDLERELIMAGAGHSIAFPDITGLCQELARRRDLRMY